MEMGDKKAGLNKLQLHVVFHFLAHSADTKLPHFNISVRQALFGSLWPTLLLSLTQSGSLCHCYSCSMFIPAHSGSEGLYFLLAFCSLWIKCGRWVRDYLECSKNCQEGIVKGQMLRVGKRDI